MPLKAIFFDAGNTLVFPNPDQTLKPLLDQGIRVSREQLHSAERAAKASFDSAALNPAHAGTDALYWNVYYDHLLAALNKADPALTAALVRETRVSARWNLCLAGTAEVLERLATTYRLGIISNADGRIAAVLGAVGIARFFSSFTDSGLVGYEKPHPLIFKKAMESLGIKPEESLHVGDIYSVDYLGARAVGMDAILLDIAGSYQGRDLKRVRSLQELEVLLTS